MGSNLKSTHLSSLSFLYLLNAGQKADSLIQSSYTCCSAAQNIAFLGLRATCWCSQRSTRCQFLFYLPSPGSPWQTLQQRRQHYSQMWRYKGACLFGNRCHGSCSLGFHLPGLGLQSLLGYGYQLLHIQSDAALSTCVSNRGKL